MKCPRCLGPLTKKTYESVEIDTCLGCGGSWLDPGELTTIIKNEQETFSSKMIEETLKSACKGVSNKDRDLKLKCPKCSAPMSSINYNYSTGIIIDSCPKNHGVWLDKQELEKIQISMEHWNKQLKANEEKWTAITQDVAKKINNQESESFRLHFILGKLLNFLTGTKEF